jgi:hypothetical protein
MNTPSLSQALIEEKAVSLKVAVEEEAVIPTKETGFQDVTEDAIVDLLESCCVMLVNEEPAGFVRRTYKGAQDSHGDDESVTSEENTLTI